MIFFGAQCRGAGAVEYWWSHALIGDEVLAGINENCDFATVGALLVQLLVQLLVHRCWCVAFAHPWEVLTDTGRGGVRIEPCMENLLLVCVNESGKGVPSSQLQRIFGNAACSCLF